MLGIIKNLFGNEETAPFNQRELTIGSTLKFAPEITGDLVGKLGYKVAGVNSYHFSEERFSSYVLKGFVGEELNLILVPDEENLEMSYFALSQQLTDAHAREIVGDKNYKLFFSGTFPQHIQGDELSMPKWAVREYARLLSNEPGRFLEGDSRLHNQTTRDLMAQDFSYTLYVDDDREHAIEVEQYTDGRTRIFATVYLPMTQIASVEGAGEKPLAVRERTRARKKMIEDVVVEKKPVAVHKDRSYELIEHELPVSPVVMSMPPKAENNPATPPVLLDVDSVLAGRLIEEAVRNEITLAALIRKVADLPRITLDKVMIPMELTDTDYALLAKKYGLQPSQHAEIQAKLKEELAYFAGYEIK